MRLANSTAVLALTLIMVLLSGCQTTRGPAPEDEVLAMLSAFHGAQKAGDVDGIMSIISDSYSNSQGADKSALQGYFAATVAQGLFDSITANMSQCIIAVEGDSATASPVIYEAPMGAASFSFKIAREPDGAWRIVNSEQIF